MKIYTKLRWTYLAFSLAPLLLTIWMARHSLLQQNPQFGRIMAAGVVAALTIALAGPWLTQRWIFLSQVKEIEKFCLAVKEGNYGISLIVPNESRDKEDENEMVNLMRDLNWMAHRIGYRENSLRKAQAELRVQKAELERAFDKMQHLAMTDALTQVANRRSFFESLQLSYRTARQAKRPISLLLLDIDHFKQINDHYGHQAGDQVLCELASRLSGCVRHTDTVARVGGEEFALLLPEATRTDAWMIADQICAVVNRQSFNLSEGHKLRVTVSIGLCSLDKGNSYPAHNVFVRYTDQALYYCKDSGRDGVCRYDPIKHSIDKIGPTPR